MSKSTWKYNFKLFFKAFLVFLALTLITLYFAFAEDEGQCESFACKAVARSFGFFRLPLHPLLWDQILKNDSVFPLSLIGNSFFWALIYERLISLIHYFRTRKGENLTDNQAD